MFRLFVEKTVHFFLLNEIDKIESDQFGFRSRTYLIEVLIERVDIYVGGHLQGIVSLGIPLANLDRKNEMSQELEGRVLTTSRSKFRNS